MENTSSSISNDGDITYSSGSHIDERDPLIINPNVNLLDPTSINSLQAPVLPSDYPGYKYVLSDEAGIDGAIALMLTISFLSSISFSVALPSLWTYVTSLGGHLADLGWAIALHSAGTIVASPLLIAWSRRRTVREVLVGSLIVMAVGGIMHGMAQNIAMLLVARFIVGSGSANYVITANYLAQVSRRTRDRALLFNGITAIVGFTLGPAFAASFTPVHLSRTPFSLDSCTAPGFFIAILAICAALFTTCTSLRFLRKKRSRRRKNRPGSYDPSNPHPIFNNSASYDISGSLLNYGIADSGYLYTETGSIDELPSMLRDLWLNRSKLPLAQLVACLFVYFVITIAFTVWETLGPVLTQEQLGWHVLYNALLYVGMGVTAGATLAIMKGLTKFFVGRLLLPCMATLMIFGALILCITAKHWTVPPFIASIVLISIGYTGSVSMVIHVYGKVLELSSEVPAPPSAVGWLSTCGSVARVLGPVCSAYLYLAAMDMHAFWLMLSAALAPCTAVACLIAMYRRLPP
eukprot:Phypoly_transcript_03695.p1 GENE.Phypoly_transcript_03695~~Phypoly_transcript_03695.p1  ORF type:complete len:521 (+),score=50.99 Phypoly_transcript_03695:522-2084(+)